MAFRRRTYCFICNAEAAPNTMAFLNGDQNAQKREIAVRFRENLQRPAADFANDSRVCISCLTILSREVQLENDPTCTKLNVIHSPANGSCLVCRRNGNLVRLSRNARTDIFLQINIFVVNNVQCCPEHLDANGYLSKVLYPGLQYFSRHYKLTGQELNDFLQTIRTTVQHPPRDFTKDDSFTDEEFALISPVTKDQMNEILGFCDPVPINESFRYVTKRDLLAFFCKLRQGLSDDFIKLIFNYSSRQAVSLAISLVRRSLMLRFVPENIGLNAITREQCVEQHVTDFANTLYNEDVNNRKIIVNIDGTYCYVEKSSNFQALRQSYSMHKGRHLVKPVLVVAPDGYIVDIHGPFFSDARNNDAAILQHEFENDAGALREWLGEDAIVIVDRGYRDILPLLEQLGIDAHMPAVLHRGQSQLSTRDANDSRLITKTRWIVEARNGHLRLIFKFFKDVIPFHHINHLRDFYLIAGAIINKYRDRIIMQEATVELAQEMLRRSQMPNQVQAIVQQQNLARKFAIWNHLNENHFPDFPILDLNYLKDLTVGIYQINLAPSYIQDKLRRDETEILEVDENENEAGFLRFRIFSRFRNATRYQLWIKYRQIGELEEEPIKGYYCTCKTGARTLGTCAHIASVLWYLGYARHQANVKYPSRAWIENVQDAALRQ